MRILALDYGDARIGCAVSDPTGTLVRPAEVIEPPDAVAVRDLARREGAELIVVGLPLHLGGGEGDQARRTREFCERLRGHVDVPVETYDERLTTRMAAGTRRAGARAAEDSLAAAHLLEGYLAAKGGKKGDGHGD
ncbi:MAG TPA: Holliday junction resolvase RuvX [Solirubrobacterales bacterium]|nr:Holliday junction resolvase RuvX [Solirubrobacterales bacterium]